MVQKMTHVARCPVFPTLVIISSCGRVSGAKVSPTLCKAIKVPLHTSAGLVASESGPFFGPQGKLPSVLPHCGEAGRGAQLLAPFPAPDPDPMFPGQDATQDRQASRPQTQSRADGAHRCGLGNFSQITDESNHLQI